MSRRSATSYLIVALGLVSWLTTLPAAIAQHGSEGTVTVTVLDPSGSVVPKATLELVDLATSSSRKGDTQDGGNFTFVNLSLGKYRLTITKPGFQTQVYNEVIVEAARTTDISATLKIGTINETVQVTTAAPLVESTSNAIGSNINLKQIEQLPMQGRDLGQLSQLVPGYTGGQSNIGGTWNGLPSVDQGSSIDGIVGSPSRMKFGGNSEPAVEPRIESIEEMAVQTDQLDMNQGFGQASMQINFVTRRGGNAFHGRVFEDFRNAALNAQSWSNDAANALDPTNPIKKNPVKLNDFGGSLGGPILKNKLFFFGTFAESRQPGTVKANNWLFTQAAQQGLFSYVDNNGVAQQVDLYQLAASQNVPNNTLSPSTAAVFGAYPAANAGTVTPITGDLNVQQINWLVSNPVVTYYPAVRVDFTPNDKMRFNVAWNMTKQTLPGQHPPDFPGSSWSKTGSGDTSKNYSASFGFDWTLSPNIVNNFRGGYLYNTSLFSYNAAPIDVSVPQVGWNYPGAGGTRATQMNGTVDYLLVGTFYPLLNASDTLSWQKKAHSLSFGFSWYQEQDHYYNAVQGFPVVNLGLVSPDPAVNAITNGLPNASASQISQAKQLYAILTGRISGISGEYAYDPKRKTYANSPPELLGYNLDELQRAWSLHFQDSYRIRPNLTINYGLRWDFTGPDHDLTGGYHNADTSAMFGPSGIYNLFNPGSFKGDANPMITQRPRPFASWNVSPQPAIGIAWNPHGGDGALGKLLGGDKTVIRLGSSLKRFTEPQQYFWNQASDIGAFFYQGLSLSANNNPGPTNFSPGSFILNTPFLFNNSSPLQLPPGKAYALSPQTYLKSEAESDFTFVGGAPGVNGMDQHIKQPYTISWNLGIQRQLGNSRALEVRYIGNVTQRQWMYQDINEVNIFQSGPYGVLTNVKAAQQNLAINNASGNASYQGSFANHGLAGQQATPLFDAAFAGEATGADGALVDYTDANLSAMVATGQAGSIAGRIDNNGGTVPYFCNLLADSSGNNGFGPCTNPINGVNWAGGPGPGLPSNFFQANPFAAGNSALYLVAEGYSNYNGLQVDFRQRQWHGLQFDANYTWSHTLGLTSPNNWQGQTYTFTLRNTRLGYGPSLFDMRHVFNINGTLDLPFGKGRAYLSNNNVLDKIVGGWSIGTIFNFQTGTPFLLGGGSGNGDPTTASTFNNNPNADGLGDGGVVLHGVTTSQLQSAIGVYRIPNSTQVSFINPKYLAPGGGANPTYITPNTTAGTIGQRVWLYGPHYWNDDMSIQKRFPIRESVSFTFQAEMLNVFNHPNFQAGPGSGCNYYCFSSGYQFPFVQGSGFMLGGTTPNYSANSPNEGARVIELRANVEF